MVRGPPAQEQLHEGKPQVGLERHQQQGRVSAMTKKIPFKEVSVGAMFIFNGNACTKVSNRTALLVQYMRTFYFKQSDVVEVANDETV